MSTVNHGLHLIQYPSGRFGFVGSVDARLSLEDAGTGGFPTDHQVEIVLKAQSENLGMRVAGVKSKVFQSAENALQFASSLGLEPINANEFIS